MKPAFSRLTIIMLAFSSLTILLSGCRSLFCSSCGKPDGPTYASDLEFLKKHTDIIELRDGEAAVALAPAYQGRVMTSTFDSANGPSFGWINRPVVEKGVLAADAAKGKLEEHIYVFGGEERFWLGPEGGQFGLFFSPNSKFVFDEWHTPAAIDTDPYAVAHRDERSARFTHRAKLTNWSGTQFDVSVERTITLLTKKEAASRLGLTIPDSVDLVAYESSNTIRNEGTKRWTRRTGLLSIWLLGMYPPTPGTTVAIPILPGPEEKLEPRVNDTYFGKVPAQYLKIEEDAVFFKGDGTRRGKIGINPQRTKNIAGSFDENAGILNLVQVDPATRTRAGYVNSMWENQAEPFKGDALNSYNDGSPGEGKPPLGPFYELETSSPAANLQPGGFITHSQVTVHLRGPRKALDAIANQKLGIGLERIEKAF